MALYAGMLMNVSLIASIFYRKNLAKSSASSSSVLLGGKGFCIVLPVSLLTRWKSSLVSFFLAVQDSLTKGLFFEVVELMDVSISIDCICLPVVLLLIFFPGSFSVFNYFLMFT